MINKLDKTEYKNLTLKYTGTSELNVDVLIKSLQSVSNGLKEISYTDAGLKVDVTVQPFKEGSFEVLFSLMTPILDGQAHLMLGAIDCNAIFNKFNQMLKVVTHFHGKRIPDPIQLDTGDLFYQDETNDNGIVVSKDIGNIEDHYLSTMVNLENLMLAADEAGGNSDLLILDEDQNVISEISRQTISTTSTNITARRNEDLLNDEKEAEIQLEMKNKVIVAICKPDLVGKSAWKVVYDGSVVSAKIAHTKFMQNIYSKKLNVYSKMKMLVDLELKKVLDENYGAYLVKGYTITHVYELIADDSDQQQDLFID